MTITVEELKRMRACTSFDMPGDVQVRLLDHIDAQAARIDDLRTENRNLHGALNTACLRLADAQDKFEELRDELAALRASAAPVAVPNAIRVQKALLWLDGIMMKHPGMKEPITCAEVLRLNSGTKPFVVKPPQRYELVETSKNPYQSYMCMEPDSDGDYFRAEDVVEAIKSAGGEVSDE